MTALTNKVVDLEAAFPSENIPDEVHLRRAIMSGAPHTYLVENTNSIGAFNAEDLHMALIGAQLWKKRDVRFFKQYLMIDLLDSHQPTQADVKECTGNPFFQAALKRMNKHYSIPVSYTAVMGSEKQHEILTSNQRTFFNFD